MSIAFRVIFLAFLAGCASTPVSRHYVLSADAKENHRITPDKRRIEIVSVRIPETVDRPQLVLTKSANEVSFNEFHRWAAPLRYEVPRVVSRNLSRILDNPTVWLRDDFPGTKPDLRIQVNIERLDAVPGDALRMHAVWMIRPADGGTPKVGNSTVSVSLQETSYDAVAVATGQVLLAISIDLARDIKKLPE
jgi:uncharacterized protein